MSDIVERNDIAQGLRQIAKLKPSFDLDKQIMIEAAAEIEQLLAQNAELKEARRNLETRLNAELRGAADEIERLRTELDEVKLATAELINALSAEIGRLRALNAKLRAALEGKE